jgi:hypothetical protein
MTRRERFIQESEHAIVQALNRSTVASFHPPIEDFEELLIPGEIVVRETDGPIETMGEILAKRRSVQLARTRSRNRLEVVRAECEQAATEAADDANELLANRAVLTDYEQRLLTVAHAKLTSAQELLGQLFLFDEN